MLTAGQGTRLKPYTDFFAKPTLSLLNIPLAYYGFYLARQGGYKNFLMNKHYLPEQIDSLALSLQDHCKEINTIDETEALLGSGGALWNARDILRKHEFFMIANGDEVLIPTDDTLLNKLTQFFKEKDTLACLLTCDHTELLKTLKPVWVTPDQTVIGFGMDRPPGDPKPVHYTGYKVFSRKILDWLPDGKSNIFYEVLVEAIKQRKNIFHFHLDQANWHETGNPLSFFKASQSLAQHNWKAIHQRRQFFGATPLQKFEKEGKQLICDRMEYRNRMEDIDGHVVLGDQVDWTPGVKLANSIVFPNVEVTTPLSPHQGIHLQKELL